MTESAEIPRVTPLPQEVASNPDPQTPVLDWLERIGRRVGLPSLLVALVSLGVSATGLSYIVANYRLTVAANRPYLVSYGLRVDFDPRSAHAELGFNNVGKVTARRGMVTLLSLPSADAPPEKKLLSAPIVGAGTNIFPSAGSSTIFDSHLTDGVAFVLACAVYFDDTGASYEQAFLFQRGQTTTANPTILPYSELAPPDQSRCRGGWNTANATPMKLKPSSRDPITSFTLWIG